LTHKFEFVPTNFVNSLGNLKKFKSNINFQRAVLTFVAKRFVLP